MDFEQALFKYGQDPCDPYEKQPEPPAVTPLDLTKQADDVPDGYEELFVRDNLHRLPSDLDQITQSSSLVITSEDPSKKKKKKRRNKNCKRLKSATINLSNERGLELESGLSQIEIQPFIPLKQINIEDDSNYTVVNNVKSTTVTSNILYDLLLKYNGFYKERELE